MWFDDSGGLTRQIARKKIELGRCCGIAINKSPSQTFALFQHTNPPLLSHPLSAISDPQRLSKRAL